MCLAGLVKSCFEKLLALEHVQDQGNSERIGQPMVQKFRRPWEQDNVLGARLSANRKRGQRKGATLKNVKNRQNVSKIFSTLFDNFRAGPKTSKIVKKCQTYFRHFSTIFARHQCSGPFWGSCENMLLSMVLRRFLRRCLAGIVAH